MVCDSIYDGWDMQTDREITAISFPFKLKFFNPFFRLVFLMNNDMNFEYHIYGSVYFFNTSFIYMRKAINLLDRGSVIKSPIWLGIQMMYFQNFIYNFPYQIHFKHAFYDKLFLEKLNCGKPELGFWIWLLEFLLFSLYCRYSWKLVKFLQCFCSFFNIHQSSWRFMINEVFFNKNFQ